MRYTQIIKEEKQDITPILREIEIKCSDILDMLKHYPNIYLFRGTNGKPDIFNGTPRQDRKPLSTPIFISEIVDNWFKQYNFKAIRSNSLFVSPSWEQAEGYGKVYMIFPENGYDYTWFENSSDFWGELTSIKEIRNALKIRKTNIADMTAQDFSNIGIDPEKLKKDVEWVIMRSEPLKTNLSLAIKYGNEIMLANCKYYAISNIYWPELNHWIKTL